MAGSFGWFAQHFTQHFVPLQIKYHEEFEKSRMGPSGGEGLEPERRDSQDSSYRRPQEQQQPPHHIPTSAPGEPEACGAEDLRPGRLWDGEEVREKPCLRAHTGTCSRTPSDPSHQGHRASSTGVRVYAGSPACW